jgi:phosphatidylethanolamine-binding protein (PEBP) family uncharacterized protein
MKPPHPSHPGMALILAAVFLLAEKSEATSEATSEAKTGLALSSTAFANGNRIPAKYSCDGDDTSPPLSWSGIPSGTKSLALIVDDPDAPQKTWVHWVLYNLPPDSPGIKQGASLRDLPPGTREGINDWHRAGYRRSVPACRPSPLRPQALRPGYDAARSRKSRQGETGKSDARPRHR